MYTNRGFMKIPLSTWLVHGVGHALPRRLLAIVETHCSFMELMADTFYSTLFFSQLMVSRSFVGDLDNGG